MNLTNDELRKRAHSEIRVFVLTTRTELKGPTSLVAGASNMTLSWPEVTGVGELSPS
jgi:hypothetical protein